jgi:hypothetical protein
MVKAAGGIMSRDFVRVLSDTIMDFPWVDPDRFPKYPVVTPWGDRGRDAPFIEVYRDGYARGRRFFVASTLGNTQFHQGADLPFNWEYESRKENELGYSNMLHTWPPWERLLCAMSLEAISEASKNQIIRSAEVFRGSMLEGIDIKSTVRSYSKGKDDLFVRDARPRLQPHQPDTQEEFPIVWIIKPGDHEGARWSVLFEDCRWFDAHVEDRAHLKHVQHNKGRKMVDFIGYGEVRAELGKTDLSREMRCDRLHGILIYQPICWSIPKLARWAEKTAYRRNPFFKSNTLKAGIPIDLGTYFESKAGVRINEYDWSTNLLLMAIPFAKNILTVVVPVGYEIAPVVFNTAAKFRIKIHTAPLPVFSASDKEKISISYMAPATYRQDKFLFSESVEKSIGELQTDNQELLPHDWIDSGEHPLE